MAYNLSDKEVHGIYFPFSIELIVCQEIPAFFASSSWVKEWMVLSILILFFIPLFFFLNRCLENKPNTLLLLLTRKINCYITGMRFFSWKLNIEHLLTFNMRKGTESAAWTITGILDIIALGWLIYFWMKLLFSPSVAILTLFTGFTRDRVAPFIPWFNIRAWSWSVNKIEQS